MLRHAVAAIAVLAACFAHAAEDAWPQVAAAYLVKRDGRLLWAGGAQKRLPPASLAKMMTALLVLENGALDRVVAVGGGSARETGTRIGLKPGEKLRARDLLAALVIRSANDACRALADDIGKTTARFVAMMNRRAQALGLADTRFADPCGHDHAGQYSSAADLARLAEAVMRHAEYLEFSEKPHASIRTADGGRSFAFDNTNALIGRYAGAIGLKTGYTARAGSCLVALAEKNGRRVLLVLLNAPNRWWDAVALLDRAFEAPPQ